MSQPLSTIVTLLLQLVQCSRLISTFKIVQSSLNFCYMVLEWFHYFFFGCTWLLWRLQSFLSSGRYSSNILTRGNSLHLDTMWSPPVSLHSSIFTIFWRFSLLHSHNAYCKIMCLKEKGSCQAIPICIFYHAYNWTENSFQNYSCLIQGSSWIWWELIKPHVCSRTLKWFVPKSIFHVEI